MTKVRNYWEFLNSTRCKRALTWDAILQKWIEKSTFIEGAKTILGIKD